MPTKILLTYILQGCTGFMVIATMVVGYYASRNGERSEVWFQFMLSSINAGLFCWQYLLRQRFYRESK